MKSPCGLCFDPKTLSVNTTSFTGALSFFTGKIPSNHSPSDIAR